MDNTTLAIYIHELRNQCLHAQASFNLFNQSVQAGQGQGVLYASQMILMPTSQIASLLWPTRARARHRGEALRKVLQLDNKHPLNDRRLSEVWERADEKTEEWIANTKGKQIAFDLVGDPKGLGDGTTTEEAIYRGFNPETRIFTYRGVSFNLPAIANALTDVAGRVNAVYRQMFPDQAKAEDEALEAQRKAIAEQQKAAEEAAKAAEEAKAAEDKPAAKKKAPAKKATAKKPAAKKKAPAKKPAAKKAPAKKAASK